MYVKREDLCAVPPAPPLGKLRGLQSMVATLLARNIHTIACWDTRVSKLGIGLAVALRETMHATPVFIYPHLRNSPVPDNARQAAALGAEVIPMRGNHVSICMAQARALIERRGGVLLPFGLECEEAVCAIAKEASTVPSMLTARGTVVVCCGSGVTLSGLVRGLNGRPARFVAISSGRSIPRIQRCVKRLCGKIPAAIEFVGPVQPYDAECREPCPFPTHPNYDAKAWRVLRERIQSLRAPIMFWNIGS